MLPYYLLLWVVDSLGTALLKKTALASGRVSEYQANQRPQQTTRYVVHVLFADGLNFYYRSSESQRVCRYLVRWVFT